MQRSLLNRGWLRLLVGHYWRLLLLPQWRLGGAWLGCSNSNLYSCQTALVSLVVVESHYRYRIRIADPPNLNKPVCLAATVKSATSFGRSLICVSRCFSRCLILREVPRVLCWGSLSAGWVVDSLSVLSRGHFATTAYEQNGCVQATSCQALTDSEDHRRDIRAYSCNTSTGCQKPLRSLFNNLFQSFGSSGPLVFRQLLPVGR